MHNVHQSPPSFTEKPSGTIDFTHFSQFPLYQQAFYSPYCNISQAKHQFIPCQGNLSHLYIYSGLDIHESSSQSNWVFYSINESKPRKVVIENEFHGHIFAIPNAYINRWGQTFDFHPQSRTGNSLFHCFILNCREPTLNYFELYLSGNRYLSGNCADLPTKPIYPIESIYNSRKTVDLSDEYALNIVIPW